MSEWLQSNMPIVFWWAALIAVAAIVFAASRSTAFAQFGVGLLSASLALLLAMALFEVIWQLATKSLGASGGGTRPRRR